MLLAMVMANVMLLGISAAMVMMMIAVIGCDCGDDRDSRDKGGDGDDIGDDGGG